MRLRVSGLLGLLAVTACAGPDAPPPTVPTAASSAPIPVASVPPPVSAAPVASLPPAPPEVPAEPPPPAPEEPKEACVTLDHAGKPTEAKTVVPREVALAHRANVSFFANTKIGGVPMLPVPREQMYEYCVLDQQVLPRVTVVNASVFPSNALAQFRSGLHNALVVEGGTARVLFVSQDPLDERSIYGRWRRVEGCPAAGGIEAMGKPSCLDYTARVERSAKEVLSKEAPDAAAVARLAAGLVGLGTGARWARPADPREAATRANGQPATAELERLPRPSAGAGAMHAYGETAGDTGTDLFAVRVTTSGGVKIETKWLGSLRFSAPAPAPVRKRAFVTLGSTPAVRGRLRSFDRALQRAIPGARVCYEAGLEGDPDMIGTASFTIDVDAAGAVTGVAVKPVGISSGVVRCIEKTLRGLTFEAPENGTATIMGGFRFVSQS